METNIPKIILDEYREYRILWERMHGAPLADLSARYHVSARLAGRIAKRRFIEAQVSIMEDCQSMPDSDRRASFTLEDFNTRPQWCRERYIKGRIEALEEKYPELKNGALDRT